MADRKENGTIHRLPCSSVGGLGEKPLAISSIGSYLAAVAAAATKKTRPKPRRYRIILVLEDEG